jgi:hypothetical protein
MFGTHNRMHIMKIIRNVDKDPKIAQSRMSDFETNLNLACQNYETTKEDRLLSVDERIILSGNLHKFDCEGIE